MLEKDLSSLDKVTFWLDKTYLEVKSKTKVMNAQLYYS